MTHLAAIARLLAHVAKEERRDGELLSAFLHRRDEAAFAELIRRHGPMVWGVCRRSLPDAADAEDAFQAAFLVLVRKAHQLTRQATVGPWLYRVAAWTARNLRRKNARRLSRTVPLTDVSNVTPRDPGFDLDAALLTLPEKYRTPLVLCHLIGLSRREAALHLGCPEGTLSARLSRALAKLRIKLLGQDPLPVLAAAAGGIVPASLATATERTAFAFVLSSLIPSASGPAAMLAEGVLRMFWIKKAATTVIAATVMMATAGTITGVAYQYSGSKVMADDPVKKATDEARIQSSEASIRQLQSLLGDFQKGERQRRESAEAQIAGLKREYDKVQSELELKASILQKIKSRLEDMQKYETRHRDIAEVQTKTLSEKSILRKLAPGVMIRVPSF